jgi:hypothetical protein
MRVLDCTDWMTVTSEMSSETTMTRIMTRRWDFWQRQADLKGIERLSGAPLFAGIEQHLSNRPIQQKRLWKC